MAMSRKVAFLLILMCAGAFCSCTHPTAPTAAQTVAIIGPKSALVGQIDTFSSSINFSSNALLFYRWMFDDSVVQTAPTSTASSVPWTFHTSGQHIIKLQVLRSNDSALLCSTVDTFWADAFLLSISPDSAMILVDSLTTFKVTGNPPLISGHYFLVWTFDTTTIGRINTDTVSYTFWNPGKHNIHVLFIDTSNRIESSCSSVVNVIALPISIVAVPDSSVILSPISFAISTLGLPKSSTANWDFGDGKTIDTGRGLVTHSYNFPGVYQVSVSIIENGFVIGTDSIHVNITPKLNGFSVAQLSSFDHASIVFSGQLNCPSNGTSYCTVGPWALNFDSLSWNAMHFSYQYSVSQSAPADTSDGYRSSSSSSYSITSGGISTDGMTLDSISAGSGYSSSYYDYPHGYGISESYSEAITGHTLQLISFSPDSAVFAYMGIIGSRIGFEGSFSYDATDPNGINCEQSCPTDPLGSGSLFVTFYKK
jgi:hypothetical protein